MNRNWLLSCGVSVLLCGAVALLSGCPGAPSAGPTDKPPGDKSSADKPPDGAMVEGTEPPPMGERRPLIWWAVPEAADVGPDDRVPPANPVWPDVRTGQVIQLAGAPGEVLGFQLVLGAGSGSRSGVRVQISSLDGRQTALPATAFALWRADWIRVESFAPWHTLETGQPPKPRLVADRLSPLSLGQRFELDGRRNQPLFAELALPSELPPGLYRGTLTLESDDADGQPGTAEIRLRVWPFRLPGPSHPGTLPILAGVNLSRLLRGQADYRGPLPVSAQRLAESRDPPLVRGRAALAAMLELLRAHGLRPMLEDLLPSVEWSWPGRAEVDWVGYDAVLTLARAARPNAPREPIRAPLSADFPDPRIFVLPANSNQPSDSPEAVYRRALRDYANQVARHFEPTGRAADLVVVYRPEAEPELAEMVSWVGAVAESRPPLAVVVPSSPRRLAAAAAGREREAHALSSAAAIWSSRAEWFAGAAVGPEHTPIWLRTSDSEPPFLASGRVECPPTGPLSWGWTGWRYRADALDLGRVNPWPLRAATAAEPSADPLADSFSDDGSPSWVYPGPATPSGRGPLRPSRRLKLLRRAIQDVQYLELAERAAGRERTESLARVLVGFALSEAAVGTTDSATGEPEGVFGGWSADAAQYEQVRRVLGAALASVTPSGAAVPQTLTELPTEWDRLSFRGERVELTVTGLSVLPKAEPSSPIRDRLELRVRVVNRGANARDDLGRLSLTELPAGWEAVPAELAVPRLEPGAAVELRLSARPQQGGPSVWSPDDASGVPSLIWDRLGRQHRQPLPIRRLMVPTVTRAPTVDGELSDWTGLPENTATGFVSLFRVAESPTAGASAAGLMLPTPMARPTAVRLVADDAALYVAFQCGQQPTDDVGCRASNRLARYRGSPWGEEAVELVLAPTSELGERKRLFRIGVKRTGVVELRTGDLGTLPSQPWSADVLVACSPLTGGAGEAWTAELRIPWSALGGRPKSGTRWGANFARHCRAVGDTGAWSAAPGHICRAESLGTLFMP